MNVTPEETRRRNWWNNETWKKILEPQVPCDSSSPYSPSELAMAVFGRPGTSAIDIMPRPKEAAEAFVKAHPELLGEVKYCDPRCSFTGTRHTDCDIIDPNLGL